MGERDEIMALLPETLSRERVWQMAEEAREDLDGEFLLYKSEVWSNDWDYEIGFDMQEREKPKKAAWCRCSACGETWHSGWREGGVLRMVDGEDGYVYTGIPDGEQSYVEIGEGDKVECPLCGEKLRATRTASLSRGRTYNILMGELTNLGRYSTVLFWMITRRVGRNADSTYSASPWAAIVIGESGKIWRFHHTDLTMWGKRTPGHAWQEQPRMGEPIRMRYYSWGCANNTCMGGYYRTEIPNMDGTTGEKTGIAAYIRGNGEFPLGYLLRQKRWKGLEALALAGWVYTMDSAIFGEIEQGYAAGRLLGAAFDLTKKKPRQMVGMGREDAEKFGRKSWKWDKLKAFRACEGLTPGEFETLCRANSYSAIREAVERFGIERTLKIARYLDKQEHTPNLTYYMDYLEMHRAAGGGETAEELYPKSLRRAHDRAAETQRIIEDSKKDAEFAALREKWQGLEWDDGKLCAVLPTSQRDLTAEGNILHHCVGGYGNTHLSGKIIVFIRHARRPERSWFTLNIDTTGPEWIEIQLHGYHNEMLGEKRLHIPQEVREFVDRWEREILTPTMKEVKRADKAKKKKKKEEKAA